MATPRLSNFEVSGSQCIWTMRSAGARPCLVAWGTPRPADSTLDRLARAGFNVLSPSSEATVHDLILLVDDLRKRIFQWLEDTSQGLAGIACAGTAPEDLSEAMVARKVPILEVTDWDSVPRWFAGRSQ